MRFGSTVYRGKGSTAPGVSFASLRTTAVAMGLGLTLLAFTAEANSPSVSAAPHGQPQLTQTFSQASGSSEEILVFDIPAQSLDFGLTALADQANLEIFYSSDQVAGRRTEGLSGRHTPEAALDLLLAGSGITYRFLDGNTVTLELAAETQSGGDANVQLEPVVVSATRTATPISELTRSVTVVTREEIDQQKRIDRSVGEILSKSVPGFSPSTEALTDFGQTLRGRTFLTLIDGAPQSTPLRDGRRSLNSIDADAIERIEVVRGGSAVYGFGASGGLVNIITRRPEEGTINAESEAGVKFSATHPDDSVEWHTNHQVSGRIEGFDYLLNGTFVQRNSFFDADGDRISANAFSVQGGLADTDQLNVLAKLGYEFDNSNQRVQVSFNHFDIFQDTDFAASTPGDPERRIKSRAVRGNPNEKEPGTRNTLVNLEYNNRDIFGSDLKLQTYYGDLKTRFALFPGFPQNEINSEKIGARLTVDTPVKFEPLPFNVVWGVDYLHDDTESPQFGGRSTSPDMSQDAIAGFVQLGVPLGDWALVRAGVRHEAIKVDVDDVLNFRNVFVRGGTLDFDETLFNASATLFLTDNFEAFGGFSQGFSLADIGRIITDTTATDVSQLESEVQVVDSYELGFRGRGTRWDASITGFLSESDSGTTFSSNLLIAKQPERIYGVELAANVDPFDQVRLGGTVSWLEGRIDLDDDGDFDEDLPSTRVPPLKITGYVDYSPFDWWTARLQGLYSGHRNPDSTQFGSGDVDPYVVFDLFSSFDTGFGVVDVGVENLLNEDYFPVLNQAAAQPFAFSTAPGTTVSLTYSIAW